MSADFIDKMLDDLGMKGLLEWSEKRDEILTEEDKLSLIDSYYQ